MVGVTSFDNGIPLGISGTGNSIKSLILCSIAIVAWSFLISLSCHSHLITLATTITACVFIAVNFIIIYKTLPFDILITNIESTYATKIYCEIVIIFIWSIAEIISWSSHDGAWVIESTTFFASAVYNAMLSRWQ